MDEVERLAEMERQRRQKEAEQKVNFFGSFFVLEFIQVFIYGKKTRTSTFLSISLFCQLCQFEK